MDPAELHHISCVIQDGLPGWRETAWTPFHLELRPALQRSLRASGRFRAAEVPDLADELLSLYFERAVAGTLLAAWDPRGGSAIRFLSGSAARHIAAKLKRDRRSQRLVELDRLAELAARDPVRPVPDSLGRILAGSLTFRPRMNQGPDRIHLVAGCQLFDHIDWLDAQGRRVAERLPGYLANCADWRTDLSRALCERRRILTGRIQQAQAAITALAGTDRMRDRERCRTRRDRAMFELLLRPLDGHALSALTGQQPNTCEQQISRYQRELSNLFRELSDYKYRQEEDR
jgi:hypothetical protein